MHLSVFRPPDLDMKKPARPEGCTNFKLRQLMRSVGQHYDAAMQRAGLKGTQYSLLSHIMKLGPIQPNALARSMRMDASTLTRNLRPLADAGWIVIGAGTNDRSRSISITEAGRQKREEARHHWKQAQETLNRTLGVERVIALHALIDDSLDLLSTLETKTED
jgi:DNA-binding MarR family transcriptional regulator